MRIVQMLPDLNAGGVERGAVELSRELVLRGHHSAVISRGGALAGDITNAGGRHITFDCGGKNIFTAPARAFQLRRVLAELRPDIVHIRSRVPAWLLALAHPFAEKNFAVVSTFHGIYKANWYSAKMAAADFIICPSTASQKYVLANYKVSAERLRLIHRGVDLDYFSPKKVDENFCAEFRRRHNLHGEKIFAIAARLNSSVKGIDIFLRAFAKTKKKQSNIRALIVGGGEGKRADALRRLTSELNIGESVIFAGGQKQMREMYAIADIVVSASTRPEAFGRTVAEALAMERPAIAPAHGGALDIITQEKNGLLFPPADADALAAAMDAAPKKQWRNLRQSATQFSLKNMAEKTLAVYKEATA